MNEVPPDIPVYRRIPGSHWYRSQNKNQVKAAAFIDAKARLSVYLSNRQTPRSILQLAIDKSRTMGNTPFLIRNGNSVEELVEHRWRVIRIPLSSFTESGLTFEKVGSDGHLELLGDPTLHLKSLVDAAVVLDAEECLA